MNSTASSLAPGPTPFSRLIVGVDPGLDQHGVATVDVVLSRRVDRRMWPLI